MGPPIAFRVRRVITLLHSEWKTLLNDVYK
jgi:hypothetical protein